MALYKYAKYLKLGDHSEYDALYKAGDRCSSAGIYRCEGCADEIALAKGSRFPSSNQHEHRAEQGPIEWRLIVCAQHTRW